MFPSLFISHGAPNTILKATATKNNLRNIQKRLGKPKYVVIISAHWVTPTLEMISPISHELMYDFYGFEKELYEFTYELSSNETISLEILEKLSAYNITVSEKRKSFDHGVWTVLHMLYESLTVPVVQLSLPMHYTPQALLDLGKALSVLREDALLVFSGSVTHNLYDMNPSWKASVKEEAKIFNDCVDEALKEGNIQTFQEYRKIPYFKYNHPTEEHFLPLLIALGTSRDYKAEIINEEMTYSNISMSSYLFKG